MILNCPDCGQPNNVPDDRPAGLAYRCGNCSALLVRRARPSRRVANMEYAGFGKRAGAFWIDGLVTLPFVAVLFYLQWATWESAVVAFILFPPFFWFYNIFFHARWGATPGKMAMKIKVVRESDRGNIGLREALLRFAPDLALGVLGVIGNMIAISHISSTEYELASFFGQLDLMGEARPIPSMALVWVTQIWVGSELVVLLLNERKRAIHDFIAGTVVIHRETQPSQAMEQISG